MGINYILLGYFLVFKIIMIVWNKRKRIGMRFVSYLGLNFLFVRKMLNNCVKDILIVI